MIRTILLSFLLLFLSCKEEKAIEEPETTLVKEIIDSTEIEKASEPVSYNLSVEKIDSVSFFKVRNSVNPKIKYLEKITDFKTAKHLLKGIVEFDDSEKYGDAPAVKKINFKNGTSLDNQNDFYEAYFIAYFPTEDILLCEGGHSTDVSFDLKSGKQTEETGNPNEFIFSPKNTVRLNSHYGGQECSAYFIQKKSNNHFEKILQLDKEFEKVTGLWLCTVAEAFWADENTLYLSETNNADENGKLSKLFFKIVLSSN